MAQLFGETTNATLRFLAASRRFGSLATTHLPLPTRTEPTPRARGQGRRFTPCDPVPLASPHSASWRRAFTLLPLPPSPPPFHLRGILPSVFVRLPAIFPLIGAPVLRTPLGSDSASAPLHEQKKSAPLPKPPLLPLGWPLSLHLPVQHMCESLTKTKLQMCRSAWTRKQICIFPLLLLLDSLSHVFMDGCVAHATAKSQWNAFRHHEGESRTPTYLSVGPSSHVG